MGRCLAPGGETAGGCCDEGRRVTAVLGGRAVNDADGVTNDWLKAKHWQAAIQGAFQRGIRKLKS